MQKKYFFLIIYLFTIIFSVFPENPVPALFKHNNSIELQNLFTLNVGIMELKDLGDIDAINPIDKQNVVDTIKNILLTVPSVSISRKEGALKAITILKASISDAKKKTALVELNNNLFFTQEKRSGSLISTIFKEFRKQPKYNLIAKKWFENIENPIYLLNISKPFKRSTGNIKEICDTTKSNGKGPLDLLIYGDIERIEKLNIITIYFYSNILQKKIYEFSVVSESSNLTKTITEKMSKIIPVIFGINYGSLEVDSKDEDVRIFLDSNYIGRNKIKIKFLAPGDYLLELQKENYDTKVENIKIGYFENKKLELSVEHKKELQVVNFYIEPLGTKIYINSVFQGRSPFKKALPIGKYVITARDQFYENKKYILSLTHIKNEEQLVAFHLKTKDIFNFRKLFSKGKFEKKIINKIKLVENKNFIKSLYEKKPYGYELQSKLTKEERLKLWSIFNSIGLTNNLFRLKKILYYSAFWNFTFSMVVTSSLVVFAYNAWEQTTLIQDSVSDVGLSVQQQLDIIGDFKDTSNNLYAAAAVMLAYTALSLFWLFYSLSDYLLTFEKKDYLPILEYYHNVEGDSGITLGADIKF